MRQGPFRAEVVPRVGSSSPLSLTLPHAGGRGPEGPPRAKVCLSVDGDRDGLGRREWLLAAGASLAGLAGTARSAMAIEGPPRPAATRFRIACMTLPYSQFPLERALAGIHAAGFRYVALGTTHAEKGGETPVLVPDAPPERAKALGRRCRDLGLEPLMMFSMIYPEDPAAPAVFRSRIRQAAAAGVPQVLTFGHTKGGNRGLWVERFKELGPIARDQGVTIVIKQHGGETGTGAACAEIVREVADPGIMVNYDAGNVMDYLDLDPIPDITSCADVVRSFCIKDHRNVPKDQDCGPGLGAIDHYRLLQPVAFTGRDMPLCCENISAPLLPSPANPDEIDALARRAREFLEIVIRGIQA
ncbi:sugar phosphate isomerase/epimerase family protein [Aquisphaera insulae]|uniref:sugar phosphate isomerase/epimerase family protein n=1 Tax=Aquisphaera insulae TaxID=2712864 RepID=UPI0013ECD487|nr:TIM barrel protein [Aquisphaera insulae]